MKKVTYTNEKNSPFAQGYGGTRKIAFVYDAVYPFIKGGAEKRFYEIGKRLVKKGYEVHWYGMKSWDGEDVITEEGMYLHGICKAMPLYTKSGRRSIPQALYFGLGCFKLLKEDFDVIDVVHMPYFSLFSAKVVCILKRKKLFATWNEVWGREYWKNYLKHPTMSFLRRQESKLLAEIAYVIEWLSARMPDEIISISEHTTKKLQKELYVRQTIHTVPLGIDFKQIKKIEPAQEKSDVIYAGRLLEHKNVDLIIKSVSEMKVYYGNIKCLIVGNGPEETNLKKLVRENGLQRNVIFLDFLQDHKDMYSLLKSSKVFAFPSNREGFGLAALEANACGIPFVTSDDENNATKSLVGEEQNGEISKSTVTDFAAKLKELMKLSEKVNKDKYEDYAQNYDWDRITEKMEEVYIK